MLFARNQVKIQARGKTTEEVSLLQQSPSCFNLEPPVPLGSAPDKAWLPPHPVRAVFLSD